MPSETISIEDFDKATHLPDITNGLLKVRVETGVYPPLIDVKFGFDNFAKWLMEDEPFLRSIALVNGIPAGHISLVKGHTYLTDFLAVADVGSKFQNGFSEIGKFFVDPDYQHHGLGKVLFNHAIKESLESGYHPALAVVSTSHDAIRFYTNKGWKNVGSFDGYHGENIVFVYDES